MRAAPLLAFVAALFFALAAQAQPAALQGLKLVDQQRQPLTAATVQRQVVLLHFEEITERRFSGWTMGQVNLARINPSIVLKYSETPTLNPLAVSGRVSMALLEELIATASIIGRTS